MHLVVDRMLVVILIPRLLCSISWFVLPLPLFVEYAVPFSVGDFKRLAGIRRSRLGPTCRGLPILGRQIDPTNFAGSGMFLRSKDAHLAKCFFVSWG